MRRKGQAWPSRRAIRPIWEAPAKCTQGGSFDQPHRQDNMSTTGVLRQGVSPRTADLFCFRNRRKMGPRRGNHGRRGGRRVGAGVGAADRRRLRDSDNRSLSCGEPDQSKRAECRPHAGKSRDAHTCRGECFDGLGHRLEWHRLVCRGEAAASAHVCPRGRFYAERDRAVGLCHRHHGE